MIRLCVSAFMGAQIICLINSITFFQDWLFSGIFHIVYLILKCVKYIKALKTINSSCGFKDMDALCYIVHSLVGCLPVHSCITCEIHCNSDVSLS